MTINKFFYTSSIVLSVAAFSASARPSASFPVESINAEISANDSCFVHIDSNQYVIADELPRFYDEICVGKVAPAGYEVSLLYPEFKELTSKELRSLKRLQQNAVVPSNADVVGDENMMFPTVAPVYGLDLRQNLTVSRKQGYLGVGFSPIVFHEGKWKRILSCQIRIAPRQTSAAAAPRRVEANERWADNSVLASGAWAKVRVKKEGIYQLTATDIKNMGFSDLSKVKVYGYGGLLIPEKFDFSAVDESVLQTSVADDLTEVPTLMTSDGRLLFWAEGTTRLKWNNNKYSAVANHYSNASYYFVTENDAPRMNVESLEAETNSTKTLNSVPYISVNDYDFTSWYPGGRRFFDEHDFATGSKTYRLMTPDAVATNVAFVDIGIGASSTTASKVTSSLNDVNLGTDQLSAYAASSSIAYYKTISKTYNKPLNDKDANSMTMKPSNNNKMRVDFININYTRALNAEAAPYSFSPQESLPVTLEIAKAKPTTRLWRIGQTGSPTVAVPAQFNDGVLQAVVSTPKRRYAFFDEAASFSAPEFVGMVENQNLHAHENVDYVIIVPANGKLVNQAARLAGLHKEREGMSYSIVRADQLYNEFSSGTPDASAYRRYLKMLYDRAGDNEDAMPKYCLLMGKSPWDNRFVTEDWKDKDPNDYLLSFEVDNNENETFYSNLGSVHSYLTDDFYGFLDDDEAGSTDGKYFALNKLDLTLGRMVCVTEEDAKRLVDKTQSYMQNEHAGIWKNTIVMLADDGDKNKHMEDAESVVQDIAKVAPNLDVQKVYWDRYPWASSATGYSYPLGTAQIKKLMAEGAVMFNYSGHGSPGMISHYKLLTTNDFKEALSPTMPLWVLASCEIYPFDSNESNIAETSLFLENGGGIAFMCATRSVYRDQNNVLNRLYCKNVLSRNARGELNTMGDALRLAKVQAVTKSEGLSDNSINKLKYVHFGDPALKLAIPTGSIVVDSINGKAVSEMKGLEVLPAGAVATISGHVCQFDDASVIDETFNGNVSVSIFDREEHVVCKNNKQEHTTTDPKSPLIDPMEYSERAKSVFKGSTKAKDGKFSFTLVVPRDISYSDESGRITLYAISEDKLREYNGVCYQFCLNGTSDTEVDTEAPKVVVYVNSIDNPDYTITDENPVLIADVSDDFGINNAGISLGHDIELVLDGNTSECFNLNSYFTYDFGSYQKGQIVYPLKNLERGPHNAQIRVWDVNNNFATADVNFIVRTEASVNREEGYVTATRNPATTNTQFISYFPADAEVNGLVYYEVYDTRGRCVFKDALGVSPNATSSTYSWDLCGNDHQPLPAGVYFYRTVINTSKGTKATDAQKLIITRQ